LRKKLVVITVLVLFAISMLCLFAVPAHSQETKWGKHKKKQPLFPFTINPTDPREEHAQRYLEKQLTILNADLLTYSFLAVQIQDAIAEINTIELMSVSDPAYAPRFNELHGTLAFIYSMEGYVAI
jgi:hypothetical protein